MISFVNDAVLAIVGSLVVSIIAKATLILALALVTIRLARRNRASIRHAVLAAAFGVLLVLPIASTVAPPFRISLPVAQQEQIEPVPRVGDIHVAQLAVMPYLAEAANPPTYALSLSTLLFGAWLAGAAIFQVPLIVSLWQLRSLRRSGLPWRGGQTVAEGLAFKTGIHQRVEVLLHESLSGPMTCGLRHPAIVFSPDALDWHDQDLNRAFVHELEHVRRGDWIWQCLARSVCSVYWFHPLVWIAWRHFTVEAERACDDAVLRNSEPTAYADQLVGLARRISVARKPPLLAMAGRSDLSTRVSAVLDGRQQRGRAGTMLVSCACATAALLLAAISPLTLVAAPQSNSSPSARNSQRFEVASVRLEAPGAFPDSNNPEFRTITTVFPSNRLTIRHTYLRSLISDAFGVDYSYVRGGPDWLERQHYQVNAKVEGNALLTRQQMRPLLQNLLEERFRLKTHRERKIVPGYALVIAKGGPRLQPNKGAPFLGMQGGYTMKWQNVSLGYFARMLENSVKRAVVDKTGIKGMYDFELKFGPHGMASEDPVFSKIPESLYANLPDIFTVLQEKLGLKLVPEKVTIDMLVIDHVDRVPTEN